MRKEKLQAKTISADRRAVAALKFDVDRAKEFVLRVSVQVDAMAKRHDAEG